MRGRAHRLGTGASARMRTMAVTRVAWIVTVLVALLTALLLALSGRDLEGIGPARFAVTLPVVEGDVAAYRRLLDRMGSF